MNLNVQASLPFMIPFLVTGAGQKGLMYLNADISQRSGDTDSMVQ